MHEILAHTKVSDVAAISLQEASKQTALLPGFAREADMLAPLRDHRKHIAPRSSSWAWHTLYEVPVTSHGIVDVMHIAFNTAVLEWRLANSLNPILDWWELFVFLTMQSYPVDGVTVAALAEGLGMSINGLRRGALRRLMENGHIDRLDGQRYIANWTYRGLAHQIIAIEAKRTNWRAGIQQAGKYARFADRAYLALEPKAAQNAISQKVWVENHRIGVLAVDPQDLTVRRVRTAPLNSHRNSAYRTIACEYAASLVIAGMASGPILPVFGEIHTASSGADPRT